MTVVVVNVLAHEVAKLFTANTIDGTEEASWAPSEVFPSVLIVGVVVQWSSSDDIPSCGIFVFVPKALLLRLRQRLRWRLRWSPSINWHRASVYSFANWNPCD